jgi:hypothetical protein
MSEGDRLLKALGALAREQEQEAAPDLPQPSPSDVERIVAFAVDPRPPTPISSRRRGKTLLPIVLVPVALAATWLLWARGNRSPLPEYVATLTGGVAPDRGTRDVPPSRLEPIVLEAGAAVQVVLQPATEVAGPVEARAFWSREGKIRPWTAAIVETSETGSLRLRGPAESPFGPGEGELILLVGRKGQLPGSIEADEVRRPPPAWRLLRQPVRWQ